MPPVRKHVLRDLNLDTNRAMCDFCGGLVRIQKNLRYSGEWYCRGLISVERPRKHRLSEINETNRTAICRECGPVSVYAESSRDRPRCWKCKNAVDALAKKWRFERYRVHLKDSCEACGFVPVHLCQLDAHHLNGDHKDNRAENIQTLCANCHRLTVVSDPLES